MQTFSKAGVRRIILDKKERKALADALDVANDLKLYDVADHAHDGAIALAGILKRIDDAGHFDPGQKPEPAEAGRAVK